MQELQKLPENMKSYGAKINHNRRSQGEIRRAILNACKDRSLNFGEITLHCRLGYTTAVRQIDSLSSQGLLIKTVSISEYSRGRVITTYRTRDFIE